VLLLPGYGTSSHSFLPSDPDAMPAYLAGRGFDPWMLDFRGTGESRYVQSDRPVVCIDRKIQFDMPAAVRAICEDTGARTVDIIGHSMGGIIAYGYLTVFGDHRIRRAVTLSSPGYFRWGGRTGASVWRMRARVLRHSLRLVDRVPTRSVMRAITRLPLRGAFNVHFHPDNYTDAQARLWVRESSTDLYRAELEQILSWFDSGELTNRAGTFSYSAHLHRITTPMLFIVASGDRIVDKKAVRWAYENVSSGEKDFLEIGVENGAAVDFGHTDLVAGRHAPRDVFSHVAAWLLRP
jgi:pimeloyl-ACP methyl ester carboxylesterase